MGKRNLAHRRKHGISFEEAATIFDGPVLSIEDEGHDGEVRERSYGLIGGIVVACHPYGPGRSHTNHQRAQSDTE